MGLDILEFIAVEAVRAYLLEVNVKGAREQSPLLRWHWLAALALLIVNDRVLKHAGLLPSWLTGKLSDFAGLYVAPVALASLLVLLIGRRSHHLLTLSAALTALGFSLLQLSEACVSWAERSSAAVGLPWVITRDPTDLVALVSVAACVVAFRRWFDASLRRSESGLMQRGLERGVLAIALFACAASSNPDDGFIGGGSSDQPALVNGSETEAVELRVQVLRQDIQLDCEAIAEDPGARLPRTAFSAARRFSLEPLQIASFDTLGLTSFGAECFAVMLQLDGREPRIAFWLPGDIEERRLLRTARSIPSRGEGVILVDYDDELIPEQFRDLDGNLLHEVRTNDDVEPECSPSSEQWEVMAGNFMPNTTARIDSVRRSLDGCFRLELSTPSDAELADALEAGQAPSDSFVSVESPFEQGSSLGFDAGVGDAGALDQTADGGIEIHGDVPDAGAPFVESDAGNADEDSDSELFGTEAGTMMGDAAVGEAPPTDDSTRDDSVPSEPTPDESTPGEPTPGEPTAGDDVSPVDGTPTVPVNPNPPTTAARVPGGPSVVNICILDEAFPFNEGELVQLSGSPTAPQITNSTGDVRLTLFQRLSVGRYISGGAEVSAVERFGCGFRTRDNPPATLRLARLAVESAWGQFEVDVGESHTIEEDGTRLSVGLSAATEQVLGETLGMTYSGYMLREMLNQ